MAAAIGEQAHPDHRDVLIVAVPLAGSATVTGKTQLYRAAMQAAPPISQLEFRRAMGNFATGVTVVTGTDGGEPLGFACQSFASVSLDPPLVLFCADHRGRSWPRIRRSGHFCVNVLAEDQADVCARFGSSHGRRFQDLEWDTSAWGCPALREVVLRVHARVADVHKAGDHDVVIGEVRALEQVRDDVRPMVFFRASFSLDPEPDPMLSVPYVWGWGDHWG